MKAIVYNRYGKPDVLEEQEVGIPSLPPDRILIKVYAAGVNPKDCLVRKGKFKLFTKKDFPKQLGYDFAGVVAETGQGIDIVKPGDAVYGMLNGWTGTTYAEYLIAAPDELSPMPDNLTFTQAAAVPLAAQTALQALRDIGKINSSHQVCINGASGGVGTYAVQIAKTFDAQVTGICSQANVGLITHLGADHTIDYHTQNILKQGKKYHIFFDVFGNFKFKKVKQILKPGGIYISTIPSPARLFKDLWHRINHFGKEERLVVVKSKTADLRFLKDLIEKEKLTPIVDKTFPLSQARDAHTYVETKRARGKIVLTVRDTITAW
jgi:NADPH:quinone reductase-like Zn-dependent oxidoreductase